MGDDTNPSADEEAVKRLQHVQDLGIEAALEVLSSYRDPIAYCEKNSCGVCVSVKESNPVGSAVNEFWQAWVGYDPVENDAISRCKDAITLGDAWKMFVLQSCQEEQVQDACVTGKLLAHWLLDRYDASDRLEATHDEGFRTVNWYGERYTFSPNQAAAVELLWRRCEKGSRVVSARELIDATEGECQSVRYIFKGNPAWGTMIEHAKGQGSQGTYRLVLPDHVDSDDLRHR